MRLVKMTYVVTKSFPKEDLYGLTSQVRRAAVSMPSNLAEGAARAPKKEFAHHSPFLFPIPHSLFTITP